MRIDIYMSCPVCLSEGYNTPKSYWVKTSCGSRITLDDKGIVRCKKGCHSSHILTNKFKCNNGRHDFKVASTAGLAAAISTSSHFVNGGGISWLQSVLRSL